MFWFLINNWFQRTCNTFATLQRYNNLIDFPNKVINTKNVNFVNNFLSKHLTFCLIA